MTEHTMRLRVREAFDHVVQNYPETLSYLAEVEHLEREEGLTEREAAARARPRTV